MKKEENTENRSVREEKLAFYFGSYRCYTINSTPSYIYAVNIHRSLGEFLGVLKKTTKKV